MQWFEEWFDTPYYHILYSNRDYREAENFLNLLTGFLKLEKKSSIIDLACGKGRHSIYLNKLGYKVLGLDLSEQSISYDKKFENESLEFRVHDMRNRIESEPVDAVFNLFTSFGYFETEEEDKSVFRSVSEVLKSKGYFVLDFLNAEYVKKIITPSASVEKENIIMTKDDNGGRYVIYNKVKELDAIILVFQNYNKDFLVKIVLTNKKM